MSYFEKKCPSCGNTYIEGDNTCRSCGAELPNSAALSDVVMLDGMEKSDWHLFIDKNSSRYCEIFARNEGKKFFLHMNWAAFFFNFYWMFYRRMYKYGLIFLAVSMIYSFAVTGAICAVYKDEIVSAYEAVSEDVYYGYTEADENGVYYSDDTSLDMTEFIKERNEAQKALNSVIMKISSWAIIFGLLFGISFALCADCIYRRYVMKNCGYSTGGTSVISALGAIVLYVAVNEVISAIFLKLLTRMLT